MRISMLRVLLIALTLMLLTAAPSPAKNKQVAVVNFMALNLDASDAEAIADYVRNELSLVKSLDVMDKNAMNSQLLKYSLANVYSTTVDSALQLGEALGVELIVAGSVSNLGGTINIDLIYVDVNGEKLVKTVSEETASMSGLRRTAETIAEKLSGVKIKSKKRKYKKPKAAAAAEEQDYAAEQQRRDDGLKLNLYSSAYSNLLGGATSQSYLTQGSFTSNELAVGYSRQIAEGAVYKVGGVLRYTNDRQRDSTDMSVKNLFLDFSGNGWQTSFGDVYTNLSGFTLSKSISGFTGKLTKPNLTIKGALGRTEESIQNLSLSRYVLGIGAQKTISAGTRLDVNMSHTMDMDSGVSYSTSVADNIENTVLDAGIKTKLHRRLSFDFTGALCSFRNKNTSDQSSDWAAKTKLSHRLSKLRTSLSYEVVNSSFITSSGWAYTDRIRTQIQSVYYASNRITISGALEQYNNNLNNIPSKNTNYTNQPKVRLDFLPWNGSDVSIGARVRYTVEKDSAAAVQSQKDVQSSDLMFNQKLNKNLTLAITYEITNYLDTLNANNHTYNTYYDAGVRGSFDRLSDTITSLYPRLGIRSSIDTSAANPGQSDTSNTIYLTVSMDFLKRFVLDIRYNDVHTVRQLSSTENRSTSIDLVAGYKLDQQGTGRINVAYNSMNYQDVTNTANSYNQGQVTVSLNVRY